MTFARLLADVIGRLDRAGIPHMVTGSVASSWHGEPRATQDLDIVIDPEPVTLSQLLESLQADDWYVDGDVAFDAFQARSQFNAIGPDATKVDFIIRRDRQFSREEFGRRQPAELLGTPTFIPTVEDLIIAKLEWAQAIDSDRQLRDVAGMLAVAADDVDREYVTAWVERLGLRDSWERVTHLDP